MPLWLRFLILRGMTYLGSLRSISTRQPIVVLEAKRTRYHESVARPMLISHTRMNDTRTPIGKTKGQVPIRSKIEAIATRNQNRKDCGLLVCLMTRYRKSNLKALRLHPFKFGEGFDNVLGSVDMWMGHQSLNFHIINSPIHQTKVYILLNSWY